MPEHSVYLQSAATSSSQTCTSQEYLEYHTEKLHRLVGEDLIEYLLDSLPFIQAQDGAGYMSHFNLGKKKRPNKYELQAAMYRCPECRGYLVDCTGSAVCEDCAVVAWEGLCIEVKNTMSFERRGRTLTKIHRYERLVHFKDYMRSLHGDIPCKMAAEDESKLKAALADADITPTNVLVALKQCKLNNKHRKHKEFLAWKLSGREWKSTTILHADYIRMCKMFKVIERLWDKQNFKRVKGKRKVFLSYPYVFWRLAQLVDKEREYCKDVKLLKSKVLLQNQHRLWSAVCQRSGWKEIEIKKIV